MGTSSDQPAISRRRFLRGVAGLAGVSILAACGGGSTAPTGSATATGGGAAAPAATTAPAAGGQAQVTIDLWDQQTGIAEEATKKIISDFEAKNPGIKINRTYIARTEGTQADQKLLTAIAGGDSVQDRIATTRT